MRKAITIIAAAALALASCRTIHDTRTMETHDTVEVFRTDTLRLYRERTLRDTIHLLTERIVTLTERGDTVRLTNNTIIRERTIERDTASLHAVRTDTARQATAIASESNRRGGNTVPLLFVLVIIGALLSMLVTVAAMRSPH